MTAPIPRLFLCFAHPDDESFSGAGVACLYGARGADVALVTATRGEAGKAGDPPLCTREELPARREAELREAVRILGIRHLHLLAYRDRELAQAPVEEVRAALVRLIRRHRPHVVITFDPNGFNEHPDHVAISRFTADALTVAADHRWLPEAGPPHRVGRLVWTPPLPPWDAARAADLATRPGIDFVLDISDWKDRKADALRAHRTQHLSIDRHFFSRPDVDRLLSIETWRHAWGPPLSQAPAADLLAGLDLESHRG